MTWLNEYEIDEVVRRSAVHRHRFANDGAHILQRLMDWVNRNSDGWPYWQAPSKASAKLQEALHLRYLSAWDRHIERDLTSEELALLLRPVKAFLTRRGVDPEEKARILGVAA